MDDFTKLKETEHMFHWLSDDPYIAIRSNIEAILKKQAKDSQLLVFEVTSAPHWLTGARPCEADNEHAILVRSGVAFEFRLAVQTRGRLHELSGVYTWVGVDLDQPNQQKQRTWFDIDGDLTAFGSDGELKTRIYFE